MISCIIQTLCESHFDTVQYAGAVKNMLRQTNTRSNHRTDSNIIVRCTDESRLERRTVIGGESNALEAHDTRLCGARVRELGDEEGFKRMDCVGDDFAEASYELLKLGGVRGVQGTNHALHANVAGVRRAEDGCQHRGKGLCGGGRRASGRG